MNNEQIKIQIARHEKQIQILERISKREQFINYMLDQLANHSRLWWPHQIASAHKSVKRAVDFKSMLIAEFYAASRMLVPHDLSGLPTDHLFIHLINENEL